MAVKKSAAKLPKTPAPVDAVEGAVPAAAPKVARRRASAAAPKAQAAAGETPVKAGPKAPARTSKRVAADSVSVAEAPVMTARQVTDEEIRVRAYFLALESQGRGGSLDYWLRAERELRSDARSVE